MKMAAAEALWNSEDPAGFSVLSLIDETQKRDIFSIRIPGVLSFLANNYFGGTVQGINNLQADYEKQYGPGNYVPLVAVNYWSFRLMVGAGFLMLLLAVVGMVLVTQKRVEQVPLYLKILMPALVLPYLANTMGWLLTELGRQPWIVFGLQKTADAVSRSITPGMVLFSLVALTLLYGALMAVDVYLLVKTARSGASGLEQPAPTVAQ
jgi:cytochrome d ubiquinol oxidase subunit I